MKKIKANVAENKYRFFTIVDELPQVGDVIEREQYEVIAINEVRLDPEQPNSEVYDYDYYEIVKKDLLDAAVGEETIVRDYVCIKWNDPIQDMFELHAERFGAVEWDNIELALIQDPYPDGPVGDDWCFRADAMDREGNLWHITWDPKPDTDECLDYADQVEDWDSPSHAKMIDKGYYFRQTIKQLIKKYKKRNKK